MFENAEIIKEGIWIYNDSVKYKIKIVKNNILYGSGDYEYPKEISDDIECECYYTVIEPIFEKARTSISRGGFLTLMEAIEDAEKCMFNMIEWLEQ